MEKTRDYLKKDEPILTIAASARVLAESGRKGGLNLKAVDQFGDEDTRQAAKAVITAPSQDGGLQPDLVQHAMAKLDPQKQASVVLGGGLDAHLDLIRAIASERLLLGNPPSLHAQLKDPGSSFKLLDALSIPYPEIRWNAPNDPSFWLLKTGCSEGGKGVRSPAHNQAGSGDYYQRRVKGPPYSVLFLANGEATRIIGFNTLHTIAAGKTPYLFAGATNFTNLRAEVLHVVSSFVLNIVHKTGLVGLNSMDFMFDPQKGPLVLEINPRPSATMALYDADAPLGLLQAHIQAVKGWLPPISTTRVFRAFRVVLAPRGILVMKPLAWPSWCHDRPPTGSQFTAGTPFCTVEAEAMSPHRVLGLLKRRVSLLQSLMTHPNQTSSFSYPV